MDELSWVNNLPNDIQMKVFGRTPLPSIQAHVDANPNPNPNPHLPALIQDRRRKIGIYRELEELTMAGETIRRAELRYRSRRNNVAAQNQAAANRLSQAVRALGEVVGMKPKKLNGMTHNLLALHESIVDYRRPLSPVTQVYERVLQHMAASDERVRAATLRCTEPEFVASIEQLAGLMGKTVFNIGWMKKKDIRRHLKALLASM